MTHASTVIFVSTQADAVWAINHRRLHPQEQIRLFPTDTPALLYLLKTIPRSINRIDTFVKPSPRIQASVKLPLKIAQNTVSTKPDLKLWIDVFRSQLVKALSHYYILHQIARQTHCRKIIVGSSSFYLPAVHQFSSDEHLTYRVIPSFPISILSRFLHHLALYFAPIHWFLNHPQELLPFLSSFLPSSFPSKAQVLIFSNGLNLSSYHSAIKALSQLVSVKVVTDQQNFKDRLYLAKYGINGQQLNAFHSFKPPSINSKITFTPIKSTLWFISKNSLKRLSQEIVSQTLKTTGAKILAKKHQAQRLIAQVQPQLVITTHDPGPSALAFVTAAQKQKINTLVLLHGSPSYVHYFYSDSQLIWGPLMQHWLVRDGLPLTKLKLGGYPIYFDYLNYFRHHQIRPPQPTIGIITTGDGRYEWHQALYFFDLFRALSSLTGYRFLIRTHSMQHLQPVAQLASYFDIKVSLNPPLHLEEFVAQSDIIITQNSTAALIPLIAHKPTVLLDPWFPFLDEGVIKHIPAFFKVKNLGTLSLLIRALMSGKLKPNLKIQDQFIHRYCGPLTATMSDKIARQIKRLV